MDRRISFLFVPMYLIAGIISADLLLIWVPTGLYNGALWLCFFTCSLCLFGCFLFKKSYLIFLLCFLLGVATAISYGDQLWQQRLPEPLAGEDLLLEGVIVKAPVETEYGSRFDFHVTNIINLPKNNKVDLQLKKLRLNVYSKDTAPAYVLGQYWRLNVRLKPPRGFVNTNGFDYEGWLLRQGYSATGYVRESRQNQLVFDKHSLGLEQQLQIYFEHQSSSIKQWIDKNISLDNRALFSALLVGDKSGFDQSDWQLLKNTGTIHLVVVSGLHIGLMAAIGYFLIFSLARILYFPMLLLPAQGWAAVGGLSFAFIYAGLSGFSLPTQRALIMVACGLFGVIYRRRIKPLIVFLLAVLAVLLWDPLAIFSASFWLSFGAVSVLLWVSAGRISHKKINFFKTLVLAQLGISIGMLPFLAYWMGSVPLVMPLANLLAVPWVSFLLLPLLFVCVPLAILFPSFQQQILWLCEQVANLFWLWLKAMESISITINFHQVEYFSMIIFLLSIFGVLLLLAPSIIVGGVVNKVILGFLLLLACFYPLQNIIPEAEFVVTQLDVGQGLSIVIQTKSHVVVYDTGDKFSEQFDIGGEVLAPFLQGKGLHKIDLLIVSHADKDHAGGVSGLLSEIPADEIIVGDEKVLNHLSEKEKDKIAKKNLCFSGQRWVFDGVSFDVLSPSQNYFIGKSNNLSCVVKVSKGGQSVLLTGDIQADQEFWLVRHYPDDLKSQVLMAPHHGSKSSSSTFFLAAVNPDLVLISAGYHNRYGHPHPLVLDRYIKRELTIARSDDLGGIGLSSQDGFEQLQAARLNSWRYWQHW